MADPRGFPCSDLPLPCRPHLGQLGLFVPLAEVDILVEVGWLEDCPRVGLLLLGWPPATRHAREVAVSRRNARGTGHALACSNCGGPTGSGLVRWFESCTIILNAHRVPRQLGLALGGALYRPAVGHLNDLACAPHVDTLALARLRDPVAPANVELLADERGEQRGLHWLPVWIQKCPGGETASDFGVVPDYGSPVLP